MNEDDICRRNLDRVRHDARSDDVQVDVCGHGELARVVGKVDPPLVCNRRFCALTACKNDTALILTLRWNVYHKYKNNYLPEHTCLRRSPAVSLRRK